MGYQKAWRVSGFFYLLRPRLHINHLTHCDSCVRLLFKVLLSGCYHGRMCCLSVLQTKVPDQGAVRVRCFWDRAQTCPNFWCGFWECVGSLWHPWGVAFCVYLHVTFSLCVSHISHLYNDMGHVGTGYSYFCDLISAN